MVVRVGGSFAYIPGDGTLVFDDDVRTVGELRAAIEERTKIPRIKQRIFTSGGRLCDDDSALLEAHKENPDGGRKIFMIVNEKVEEKQAVEARKKEREMVAGSPTPPAHRESCTLH